MGSARAGSNPVAVDFWRAVWCLRSAFALGIAHFQLYFGHPSENGAGKRVVTASKRLHVNAHPYRSDGDLAQMVERSLSMREALGSMPRFSNFSDVRHCDAQPDTHPLLARTTF